MLARSAHTGAGIERPILANGHRRVADRVPVGDGGFGFDPVMWIPAFGKTFAELPVDIKNANSHRGRAAHAMVALMRERWTGA